MRLEWNDVALKAQVRQKARNAVQAAAFATEARAKAIAPVRTGRYRASIETTVEETEDKITARVAATVPYAAVVEVGSKGRPGRAVLATALSGAEDDVKRGLS